MTLKSPRTIALASAAFLSLFVGSTVAAQTPSPSGQCALRADIVDKLGSEFGEKRQAVAMTSTGGLLEIFASRNGSWSILISTPKGVSCVVAFGAEWNPELLIGVGA